MDEPYLAGLADALSVCESLGAEVAGALEHVVVEAEVHQQADGG